MLKHVKAIGWFVKEYGIAQVSMNLTNIEENAAARRLRRLLRSCEQTGIARYRIGNRGDGPKNV